MNAPVTFDPTRCDKNPYCPAVGVCPTGALFIDKETHTPSFDESRCTGCGTCVSSCPMRAVHS
jgi:protein NrfC